MNELESPKRHETHLAAGVMSEVIPVDLELCMIVHMYKFMHHRVFHVFFVHVIPLTEHNGADVGCESPGATTVAWCTW